MEEMQGHNHGLYIWGHSVHNIQIHFWVDWTSAVGSKWKIFLQNLEVYNALNPELYSHIWLLQHLFLDMINIEVLQ
ncbi:hypothetical protein BDR05DRAFT_891780 [Suillus weaverae]|nr:hypothetical protein BDR05DRAFT_891780 [Suillus weaverae]